MHFIVNVQYVELVAVTITVEAGNRTSWCEESVSEPLRTLLR
jgi:hypothetical protein